MMAGAIGAKLGLIWFSKWESLAIIILLAIGWEVIEFFWDGGKEGMVHVYGSLKIWFYDVLGDVVGAGLMAFVVIL